MCWIQGGGIWDITNLNFWAWQVLWDKFHPEGPKMTKQRKKVYPLSNTHVDLRARPRFLRPLLTRPPCSFPPLRGLLPGCSPSSSSQSQSVCRAWVCMHRPCGRGRTWRRRSWPSATTTTTPCSPLTNSSHGSTPNPLANSFNYPGHLWGRRSGDTFRGDLSLHRGSCHACGPLVPSINDFLSLDKNHVIFNCRTLLIHIHSGLLIQICL